MGMEELSELIIKYTEAFPCHDLEFFVLSLGYSPLLEYTIFLLGNFIKEAAWFVSSTETGYAPSVQFSHSVISNTLRAHGLQHASFPCPSSTPGAYSNSCPSSWWWHRTISTVTPSPPTFNLSQHQGLFQWVSSSHEVARVLELQLQHQSFQWIFRTHFL